MKGGHNKKSVRVEFVMSEAEAELVKERMWDYDAVTLPAACNSPVLITEGLAGVRGKYGSKIEIRYNGPDLCVQ